jgi:hypothetical protein
MLPKNLLTAANLPVYPRTELLIGSNAPNAPVALNFDQSTVDDLVAGIKVKQGQVSSL